MSLHANYVNGEWVEAPDASRNVNPSDLSDTVGEYARADVAQAAAAVAAAKAALPAWSTSGIQERADILDRAGTAILARKEELGRLLAREEGKTLPEGIGEAARAGQIFRFFGGEALRIEGDKLASVRPGVDVEITREPVGVVLAITPWNFPIAIPAWKLAPALAFGNCVVLKPADLTPGCAWALADILAEAGIPPGVFNLVMGRGSVVGDALLSDPGVDAVSFTGSVATGRGIALKAVESGKRVQLEMGGKNPLVVLDDADLDTAVSLCCQRCFLFDRPALHGLFAAGGDTRHSRPFRGSDAGRDGRAERRPCAEGGHPDRSGRRPESVGPGPVLSRHRPRRGSAGDGR